MYGCFIADSEPIVIISHCPPPHPHLQPYQRIPCHPPLPHRPRPPKRLSHPVQLPNPALPSILPIHYRVLASQLGFWSRIELETGVRCSMIRILVLMIGEIRMVSGLLVVLNRTLSINTERLIVSITFENSAGTYTVQRDMILSLHPSLVPSPVPGFL